MRGRIIDVDFLADTSVLKSPEAKTMFLKLCPSIVGVVTEKRALYSSNMRDLITIWF